MINNAAGRLQGNKIKGDKIISGVIIWAIFY